jgi:acetyl-CoA synthetase
VKPSLLHPAAIWVLCTIVQILGTVGEPINPEAWRWYHETVGDKRCPVVDTWWQTETGGHMITPLPGAWAEKPGSATLPFFGAAPALLDPESGKELEGVAEGVLCFKQVLACCFVLSVVVSCALQACF